MKSGLSQGCKSNPPSLGCFIRCRRAWRPLVLSSFAFALAVLWLPGCSGGDDRVAGGADFPNTIEVDAMGRAIVQAASEMGDWKDSASQVAALPEFDIPLVPPTVPPQTLALSKSAADTSLDTQLHWVLTDTAQGVARLIRRRSYPALAWRDSVVSLDTFHFVWSRTPGGASFADTSRLFRVSGEEYRIRSSQNRQRYAYEDADGDSSLAALQGSANLAHARFVTELSGSATVSRILLLSPGSDQDFGTESDNAIRYLQVLRRLGQDTVDFMEMKPVQSDGWVWTPDSDDANVVDVHRILFNQRGPSAGGRLEGRSRLVVRASGATQVYSIRHQHRWRFRDGATLFVQTLGLRGDSTFSPGDTVLMHRIFTWSQDDTLNSRHQTFRVATGDNPVTHADDRLISFETRTNWRRGLFQQIDFRFTPDASEPLLDLMATGEFSLRLTTLSGAWRQLEGNATRLAFDATYSDAEGRVRAMRWSRQGLPLPPVP